MADKVKVLLVEDDTDFAYLTTKEIGKSESLEFVAYAENKYTGIELAKKYQPDIVLMDLQLSKNELDGIETAKTIKLATNAKILLLTSIEDFNTIINASKKSFASGYIFKSQSQTLNEIIQQTALSHTPQEQFIKELILSDLSEAERSVFDMIFGKDTIVKSSDKTIANQKTNIFKKLGLKSTQDIIHIFRNW